MTRPTATLVSRLLADLCDLAFPALCALCGAPERGDGLGCDVHRLPASLPGPRCGVCAAGLAPSIRAGERCPACRARAPGFARLVALADYHAQPEVREWVLALKHGGRRDLAGTLGAALGLRLAKEEGGEPPVLVPVPLHPWRRLERGYDQALELARAAAEVRGHEVRRVLARVRPTPPQGSLGAASRTANVRGAFGARRTLVGRLPRRFVPRSVCRGPASLAGRAVWLVDDVVTSGATAGACATELRRLGATSVAVLCVARVSRPVGRVDSRE